MKVATIKKNTDYFLRALMLVCVGLLPIAAQAHHVRDVCTRNDGPSHQQVFLIAQQNIGRDVQHNEAYGRWFSYSISWTCTRLAAPAPPHPDYWIRPNDFFEAETRLNLISGTNLGLLPEDPSFRIYRVNNSNVGYIVKITQHIAGQAEQTMHVNSLPGSSITTLFQGTTARQHGDIEKFHLTYHVRLVKLGSGNPLPPGFPPFPLLHARLSSSQYHLLETLPWTSHSHYTVRLAAHIQNISAACKLTVPTDVVHLSTVHTITIQNLLQTGSSTGFNVQFKQCPAYINSVSYQFQPLPGAPLPSGIANGYGILPQRDSSASAAKGVAVQVLDENDQPIPFYTAIPLAGYDQGNPVPLYSIPLKAHIIRTGGVLAPGQVEAAMNVVATYK